MLYSGSQEIDFSLPDLLPLASPTQVLMTTPRYFDVVYEINPHMTGNVGTVDRSVASLQWQALRASYTDLGLDVSTTPGQPELPDMVFCANQTLPFVTHGRPGVVLSRMYAPERDPEVRHYRRYFERAGLEVVSLPDAVTAFEGMGDAIWHPGRRLLWGGHGYRSDESAYAFIAQQLETPVVLLRLVDPDFYHLDTCFSVLDERTVLVYPGAFEAQGLSAIATVFDQVLEAPEDEARSLFAVNAHCPDGKHVLIQRGCTATESLLRGAGFEPIGVDTSEYLKAGGSVFCMKQMFW